jgi:hypothetical protein
MRRTLLIAVVVSAALPGAAQASFSPPEQVAAAGAYHRGFGAVADATGRVTIATRSGSAVPRLIERLSGGPAWADLPPGLPLARRSYVYKQSISAAGNGALAVARVILGGSRPSTVLVAIRPPGGTLAPPIAFGGAAARGVNEAAVAIDAAGDVLLAYETAVGRSHLGLQGEIAIAYRPAGRAAFVGPVVVDHVLGNPPAVALAADGTGVVAWTRRGTLMAASVGRGGRIGRAEPIARPVSTAHPVVAAGPRSAATVAYRLNETTVRGEKITRRSTVRSVDRPPGGTFGRPRRVALVPGLSRELALAADEQGRATLAWTEVAFDERPVARGRVWTAAARAGRPFGRPRFVARRDSPAFGEPVSVAARGGHVALAWREATQRPTGVEVATGAWNAPLDAALVPSPAPAEAPAVGVAADGRTTAFWRAGAIWASDGP